MHDLKNLVVTLQVLNQLQTLPESGMDAAKAAITDAIVAQCRTNGVEFQDDFLSSMPTTIICQIVHQTVFPILKARRSLDLALQIAGASRNHYMPVVIPHRPAYRFQEMLSAE